MQDFHEISYRLHSKSFDDPPGGKQELYRSWLREDTTDYWRHSRMIAPLHCLLKYYSGARCVTIGDGRYGLDSVRLKKIEPSLSVLPTDISPYLLQRAKEQGLITDYKIENAEKLSFENGCFDLSFCIESYHHFPRPFLALYEMLRVSKKAVILIEPQDKFPKPMAGQLLDRAKRLVKKMLLKKILHQDTWSYEECGNYVFGVSKREVEKVALGLQLPAVAFFELNDYYIPGVEFEKKEEGEGRLFRKIRRWIRWRNIQCVLGLARFGILIAIIWKEKPTEELIGVLKQSGFVVVELPSNPYLQNMPCPDDNSYEKNSGEQTHI